MRTTVDIPEALLRRARARAALEGSRMKDVVNEALTKLLGASDGEASAGERLPDRVVPQRIGRFELPVIASSRPGQAVLTPEALKNAETDEDEQRHGEIFGR